MVSYSGCIRVFKEAYALKKRGYTVDLLATKKAFGFNHYDTFGMYFDKEQLIRAVQASPADIFHVHNEPDWIVSATREATNKPVIFDVHDPESMRWVAEPDQDEYDAYKSADALIFTSNGCMNYAMKFHEKKPTLVLPCYALEDYANPYITNVSWSSVVYEGGLSEGRNDYKGLIHGRESALDMRDYTEVVEAFINQGFNVFLFGANKKAYKVYEDLGAVVTGGIHYPNLMTALRPFGLGLVGATRSYELMEAAMPNKLFEYLSQGVVPVLMNMTEAYEYVKEKNIGIKLESFNNIGEQLAEAKSMKENILKYMPDYFMENHIDGVISLYKSLV